MKVIPFKGQDYESLKRSYSSRNLFTDNIFKPDLDSLGFSTNFKTNMRNYGVRWLRPNDINRNAKFVVDGFTRLDINQGAVGDCWFIAGMVAIAQNPGFLNKVVPEDQISDSNYCGIYHFRFNQYGDWYDIVIDDYLPCSHGGQLLFCQNKKQPNEFWPALLEKAFAKLHGSYEALNGGILSDALTDLTGGISQNIYPKSLKPDLLNDIWITLYQAHLKNSLSALAITGDAQEIEKKRNDGLIEGHAYTITKMAVVVFRGNEQKLVRIKNPWGNQYEWSGPWSDKSSEWNSVSDKCKKDIGLVIDSDGEFWMSYEDFLKIWDVIYLCHLTADCFLDELFKKSKLEELSWKNLAEDAWESTVLHSKWEAGKNCGGSEFGKEKYWTNPKLLFEVKCHEEKDLDKLQSIIISLSQKKTHLTETLKELNYDYKNCMIFTLYSVPNDVKINKINNLSTLTSKLKLIDYSDYTSSRDIVMKVKVKPGFYIVVPSLHKPDVNLSFVLKLITEEKTEIKILDESFIRKNFDDNYIYGENEIVKNSNENRTNHYDYQIRESNASVVNSNNYEITSQASCEDLRPSVVSIAESEFRPTRSEVSQIRSDYKIRESNMSGSFQNKPLEADTSEIDFRNRMSNMSGNDLEIKSNNISVDYKVSDNDFKSLISDYRESRITELRASIASMQLEEIKSNQDNTTNPNNEIDYKISNEDIKSMRCDYKISDTSVVSQFQPNRVLMNSEVNPNTSQNNIDLNNTGKQPRVQPQVIRVKKYKICNIM